MALVVLIEFPNGHFLDTLGEFEHPRYVRLFEKLLGLLSFRHERFLLRFEQLLSLQKEGIEMFLGSHFDEVGVAPAAADVVVVVVVVVGEHAHNVTFVGVHASAGCCHDVIGCVVSLLVGVFVGRRPMRQWNTCNNTYRDVLVHRI